MDLALRVAAKRRATADIAVFDLVPAAGTRLPAAAPGAHIDLALPGDLIRQYSLCGDATERTRWRIGVLREPASRGGSAALCDRIEVGDGLRVTALRNNFALQPARRSLLLGGGIGITPLLPMAAQLGRMGMAFQLHYYVKSRRRAAFLDDIAAAAWAERATLHCSDEGGSARGGKLADLLAGLDGATHIYACGPAGFVEHVIRCASVAGLDERRIHYEPFALPVSMRPVLTGPAFEVVVKRTGRRYLIPADEPPTRALLRQGVRIPVSCEEGHCGTCETRVLEGVPDHRDSYLGEAEKAGGQVFMPCCSRAKTPRLVIELP